jgi:hypothetical protein
MRCLWFGLALYATPAAAETQEDCKARWLAAEKAGIVYGVGMLDGVPSASVDEITFNSVPFETKLGFAETLNCAVVGPDRTLAEIQFLSHRTNKRLARWTPGKGLVVD